MSPRKTRWLGSGPGCIDVLRDTKGNLNKQKDTLGWSGRLLILKMSVFFTQIHKFNVTSIKIVTGFLMNITARSN